MLIQLQNRGVLQIEGPDSLSFLQGLITQDMALLEEQTSLYTCLLTPQGKIMFDFFIFKIGAHYLLDCVQDDLAQLETRLNMYKLRSDLTISNVSDAYCTVVDIDTSHTLPPDPRLTALGGRMIISQEEAENTDTDDTPYHSHRMKLGIAESGEINASRFFPHECNMDQLFGVSFTKGCFVGQEVVSRMEHKTVVRKRILPYSFADGDIDESSPITCEDQKLGENISTSTTHGLAIIRLDRLDSHATDAPVRLGDIDISLYKPVWADIPSDRFSETQS